MNGVFSSISSEYGSERSRGLSLSSSRIGWSNKLSPARNSSAIGQFHSNADITSNKLLKIWIKWLILMLSIKLSAWSPCEFGHFQFVYLETLLLNCINYFTHILIRIWFDHCERWFSLIWLFASCCNISIFFDHNDSAENSYLCSNKHFG